MTLDFRYRRLGYVALNVSDLSRSQDFYQQLVGLQAAGEALAGERLLRCTSRHHDVVLHLSDQPGLRRVGWEMESADDLGRVRAHLGSLGLPCRDVPDEQCAALGIHDGFRASEPVTGVTFEYYHTMAEAGSPFAATHTHIERLGHVVVGTHRYEEAERQFVDNLNFRTSDRMNPAVFWMRCFPNPLHHSFAIGRAKKQGLHHVNFMVTDIDDIGKALWRLKKHDVPIVFGPGRHPPSDSVFLYYLDPDQLTLEFSFGMEEFPEQHARAPRDLKLAPESIDYWGAQPDPRFAAVGQIEPLEA
jgi:2,3-dihydroxy-p-cumate/2,3-dihydroxybenzoate 3,4-dioxygenase